MRRNDDTPTKKEKTSANMLKTCSTVLASARSRLPTDRVVYTAPALLISNAT